MTTLQHAGVRSREARRVQGRTGVSAINWIARMARRSANECAAILDVYGARHLVGDAALDVGRELLVRIVAMLTRMVVNCRPREREENER